MKQRGKNIWVNQKMHQNLKIIAAKEGIDLQDLVAKIITNYLKRCKV